MYLLGYLDVHCNYSGLLQNDEQQRLFQNSCHVFNFNCGFNLITRVIYGHIENLVAKPTELVTVDNNNHYYVMNHFIMICKGFGCFLTKKLFTWLVLASV